MALNLRVISYNCQSFNTKTQIIGKLLDSCDILCLQETLLNNENFINLENLNSNFLTAHVPAVRNHQVFRGRGSGGLAILWRKSENVEFSPVFISDRMMGLKIKFNDLTYFLINIYCFCDYGNADSLINYKSQMAELSNFCENEEFDDLVIAGDMNADPIKGRFFMEFSNFVNSHSYFVPDIASLPNTSYTYISSNSTCSTSWLDHVVTSRVDLTSNHNILYGCTFYDHIPFAFELNVPFQVKFARKQAFSVEPQNIVLWDRVSQAEKNNYSSTLDDLSLYVSGEVFSCNSPKCSNEDHLRSLRDTFSNILECISIASDCLPCYKKFDKKHRVVGWNVYCKDLYSIARENYLNWHGNGKIRSGPLFENMKLSRSDFKNALKYCRDNELKIKKQNLLAKFRFSNKIPFWKEVSKLNGKRSNEISCIDGKSDSKEIAYIFDRKFNKIFDDKDCQSQISNENSWDFNRDEQINFPLITINDIRTSIDKLNMGMGWDKIHSNHLKFSGPVFKNLLSKLFNKFLSHHFVPEQMIGGQIKPVLKGKSSSKVQSSNFRPVMNSSNFLKIFEYCLQPFLLRHLRLNNLQFGFRPGTSCTSAVLVLRETVHSYTKERSNVHCAMVDLSKAFDKVNHKILIDKFRKTTLPVQIIDVLEYMFNNTFVNVLVNDVQTESWRLGNGTRQGGILSPLIFSFYIDDVISEISNLNEGCSLGGVKTNIICYADDISILAPSASGLQRILDVLYCRLSQLGLSVNFAKCSYMVFKAVKKSIDLPTKIYMNGHLLDRVNDFKYLGVILSQNMMIGKDVDRVVDLFLKQFYSMYSKFSFLDKDLLYFLFKSYTSSFYGAETWATSPSKKDIHKVAVVYHKAVKKIAGLNVWDSNHEACSMVKAPIFRHMLSKRYISFLFSIIKTSSPCLAPYKYYFRYFSKYYFEIKKLFSEEYGVIDVYNNPLCALLARIQFVQDNEPRSR